MYAFTLHGTYDTTPFYVSGNTFLGDV